MDGDSVFCLGFFLSPEVKKSWISGMPVLVGVCGLGLNPVQREQGGTALLVHGFGLEGRTMFFRR